MKLVSYRAKDRTDWGVLTSGGIVEGRALFGGAYRGIKQLLSGSGLNRLAEELAASTPSIPVHDVELLPVIPDAGQIYCAGLNYREHAIETNNPLPDFPRFFARVNTSLIGHECNLIRPKVSHEFDFEGELALVIGKRGRHIQKTEALDYIAGYTCFMDGSIRDWQRHTTTTGKNFHATGALGPWMVTADEISDPAALMLTTRLNGNVMQHSRTDDLIFDIPEMLAYLSKMNFLEPGDIIATGTPDGVGFGRKPPVWLRPGDTVEVEISGIGTLRNRVVDEE